MSFDGLRVLSLESRRASQIETLIRRAGGDPFVAPSMRETPLEQNAPALAFAERLFANQFDMLILLTGVGTRLLNQVIETGWRPERSMCCCSRPRCSSSTCCGSRRRWVSKTASGGLAEAS